MWTGQTGAWSGEGKGSHAAAQLAPQWLSHCWDKDGSSSLWGHGSVSFVSLLPEYFIFLVYEQLKEAEENDFSRIEAER